MAGRAGGARQARRGCPLLAIAPLPPILPVLPHVCVHRQRPHIHGRPGSLARRREQPLDAVEIAARKHGDRWSGTGKIRTEYIGIVDGEDRSEVRYQRGTSGLMPTVLQRLAQTIVLAMLERVNQRKNALQVEHGVRARNRRRQRCPRLRCQKPRVRRCDYEAQISRPFPP